jgi:hypothetical protein
MHRLASIDRVSGILTGANRTARSDGEERLVSGLLLLANLTKRIVRPEPGLVRPLAGLLERHSIRAVEAGADGDTWGV